MFIFRLFFSSSRSQGAGPRDLGVTPPQHGWAPQGPRSVVGLPAAGPERLLPCPAYNEG